MSLLLCSHFRASDETSGASSSEAGLISSSNLVHDRLAVAAPLRWGQVDLSSLSKEFVVVARVFAAHTVQEMRQWGWRDIVWMKELVPDNFHKDCFSHGRTEGISSQFPGSQDYGNSGRSSLA